jgi:hypothetical protein
VRVAWVFGSRAAGTATSRSDLDVAVVFARDLDGGARESARRRIVAALTDAMGVPSTCAGSPRPCGGTSPDLRAFAAEAAKWMA